MRITAMLLVLSLTGASCDKRPEEPLRSPPPKAATIEPATTGAATAATIAEPVSTPDGVTATATPRPAPSRCLVATPEAAPPSVSPAQNCPPDPLPGGFDLSKERIQFIDAPGQPEVEVELAQLEIERERGLMYRTTMPETAGMLFVFDRPSVHTFWMHNTCIPLDMMFVAADGFITGILENVPTLNDASRSIPCPVAYVLEVNAGWSRKHGVRAGQRIKLPPRP